MKVSITKEQLSTLPTVIYPGQYVVVETDAEADEAMNELFSVNLVGFDTESKPSFKKGQANKVSLIQISSGKKCYLFRINKIGFPERLKSYIENPSVAKIGLSLKDDFFVLQRSCSFAPAGFIDLQSLVKNYNIEDTSLQKIFAILFGKKISKSQRLSNWEADELTDSQKAYASIDAWACLEIYNYLTAGKFNPVESPYLIEEDTQTDSEP